MIWVQHVGKWYLDIIAFLGPTVLAKRAPVPISPPQIVKSFLRQSLGQSQTEWVICIHSSVQHHQTGSSKVFTALPGGRARTGFSHSRWSGRRDCRGRWEQDRNDVWLLSCKNTLRRKSVVYISRYRHLKSNAATQSKRRPTLFFKLHNINFTIFP